MKMTGKSEEELRKEMNQELEELEREVSALKEVLKTKPTPKAKGGKKAVTTEGDEQKEEKPKKAAPKKKAAATVVETEATEGEVKEEEKPKAKKAAPKKKAEATEGEEKPKAKKAAPKKKAATTEAVKELHEPELLQELEREIPASAPTDEEEEVEVEEIEYQGVKYLRSTKGVVYDIETSEEIGTWNDETRSIEVE